MEISAFFKSLIDSDNAPIVICDINHIIVYMNPSAVKSYKKLGGISLVGKSLLDCHNSNSNAMIKKVIDCFKADFNNNKVFTTHNEKENKDVYMIALRDENNELIGYYEKHEYRNVEKSQRYDKK